MSTYRSLSFLSLLLILLFTYSIIPPYQEFYYTQTLDHFNYLTQPLTYQQRYLIYQPSTWKINNPIFFYTGNEGDITSFYNNTGLIFELSEIYNALVIFAEHRYYGKSLPFGPVSPQMPKEQIGLLSIDQALADYAQLVIYLKEKYNTPSSKVISFGGSYGGRLSAWFRIKYPNLVDGSLAASAPILLNSNNGVDYSFFQSVTNDFTAYNPQCSNSIRNAFSEVIEMYSTSEGRAKLTSIFSLCDQLEEGDGALSIFTQYIRNSFVNYAMMDYPYQTSFMASLPAFPVNAACDVMLNASDILIGLAAAANIGYFTEGQTCYDLSTLFFVCSDQTGCGGGSDGYSWDYQSCSQQAFLASTNNITDMFPPLVFNNEDLYNYCNDTWGVIPRSNWVPLEFGGANLNGTSNIIFSNGLLDPWHVGGFLTSPSVKDQLISLFANNTAHHFDLRESNKADPESIINMRKMESYYIGLFIEDN